MSTHIEWLNAADTSVQVFAPGDEWVGEGMHRRPVLTLAHNEVVAIGGSPAEIQALCARISAVTCGIQPVRPDARVLIPTEPNPTSATIEIEWSDGTRAVWSVSEGQADTISAHIETTVHNADSIRC